MALPIIPILVGLGAAGSVGSAFSGPEDLAVEKWRRGEYGPQGPLGRIYGAGQAAISDMTRGLNYLFTGGQSTPGATTSTAAPTVPPTAALTNVQTLDKLRAMGYLDGGGGAGGGMVSAAQRLNQQEMQNLRNYWNQMGTYGQNRAAALQDMYSGLAASRARSGAAEARSGINLAADIENLYNRLGAQAGQPMVTPDSPTAGLAPMSGEAALAAQTIPAQGGDLANYLAAATGAQAQNIYDIARAQAEQGGAVSQNFIDMLTMAQQQAMLEQRNRAATRLAQAQAQASAASAAGQNRINELYLQAALQDITAGQQAGQVPVLLEILRQTDPDSVKRLDKAAKSLGYGSATDLVKAFPGVLSALGGE